MPGNDPQDPSKSGSPIQVDPQRLSALVERANQLRDAGDAQFLRTVLKGLDERERLLYAQPLADRLNSSADEPSPTEVSMHATSQGDPIGNATIDLPNGFEPIKDPADLPPISRDSSVFDRNGEPLPEKIGKFRIKGELGRGAFGVVYLGYDDELQRNVAVKVSLVADTVLQERLRVEASKLAQVESPGIVPVYHIGKTDDGKFYIVQKYIQGTTLRDVIKQSPLSPLMAVARMRDCDRARARAHA